MKFNNPLPQPLAKECEKAAKIFQSFVDNGNNGLDGVIPRHILENAKGFAIFTIFKAGFVFSARAGSGVVIAKLDNGTWSAPSAIGTAGLGVGTQLGAEVTDFLIVLNSRSAISFMAAGTLSLGGNMSLALGPLGRNGEAAGAVNTNGKVAAMYSYSKTRGLFGGVSLEGSVIVERQDANHQAYDSPVTSRLLLGGQVEPPPWAMPLIKTLEACTGMPGTRTWINDEANRTPGGSYVFEGPNSPSSARSSMTKLPSFLRKKKPDAPSFPPASWGMDNNSGSYFTNSGSQSPQSHLRNKTWDGADYLSDSRDLDLNHKTTFPSKQTALEPWDSELDADRLNNRSSNPFNTGSHAAQRPTSEFSTHQRSLSLKPSPNGRSDPFLDSLEANTFPTDPSRARISAPLFKSPDPGIVRAVALFDFNAIQDEIYLFARATSLKSLQRVIRLTIGGQDEPMVVRVYFPLIL